MQMPISAQDSSLPRRSLPAANDPRRPHTGSPRSSNTIPSSHAWQYHEIVAVFISPAVKKTTFANIDNTILHKVSKKRII